MRSTAIEQARRDQAERRGRVAEAQQHYDAFLAIGGDPGVPDDRQRAEVRRAQLRSDDARRRRAAAVRAESRRRDRDGAGHDRGSAAAARHRHARARQPRRRRATAASRAATRSCSSPKTMSSRCCWTELVGLWSMLLSDDSRTRRAQITPLRRAARRSSPVVADLAEHRVGVLAEHRRRRAHARRRSPTA